MNRLIILFSLIGTIIMSCDTPDTASTEVATHGMFAFPGDFIGDDDHIPAYLDPETILCNGKGIKVANCISRQLKKGICLGIIKHQKRVYALEIPCDDIKNIERDSFGVEKID